MALVFVSLVFFLMPCTDISILVGSAVPKKTEFCSLFLVLGAQKNITRCARAKELSAASGSRVAPLLVVLEQIRQQQQQQLGRGRGVPDPQCQESIRPPRPRSQCPPRGSGLQLCI